MPNLYSLNTSTTVFRWRNGAEIDVWSAPSFENPWLDMANQTDVDELVSWLDADTSYCTAIVQKEGVWGWDIVDCDSKFNKLCDSGEDHAQCWMLQNCAQCALRADCGWCGGHCQLTDEVYYDAMTHCHWEPLPEADAAYECSLLWPTTNTLTDIPGCCAGDSMDASGICAQIEDEFKCDARPACRWIYGKDAICTWTEPGCCCSNPSMAYSVRWDEKCKENEDLEWYLKWIGANGVAL